MADNESEEFNISSWWAEQGMVEPTAINREWAKTLYGMYTALLMTGFNELQALTLVCQLVKTSLETTQ